MKEKYEICKKTGILKQITDKTIEYTPLYSLNSYDKYGENTTKMSYLRLGYLIGSIDKKPSSLCDVGYGNGSFLKTCKEYGIVDLVGVDIAGYNIGDNKILQVREIPLNTKFDVVCFFDSLEHFEDISFLEKIRTNYIYISYPECHYYDKMKDFENWKHRRPNEHIYHFNRRSIKSYMSHCGYMCVADSSVEDVIRKSNNGELNNITSLIFQK